MLPVLLPLLVSSVAAPPSTPAASTVRRVDLERLRFVEDGQRSGRLYARVLRRVNLFHAGFRTATASKKGERRG
jgi:hypothetical protein